MKRSILMVAAVSMLASIAMAQTTNVVSVNVVGYVKVDMLPAGKFSMVGLSFQETASGESATLLDVFGTNQLDKSVLFAQSDRVYLWDRESQQFQTFFQKTDGNFYNQLAPSVATNPAVAIGTAMWLQSKPSAVSGKTLTILGSVPMAASVSDVIEGDSGRPFFFIANPYPVPQAINDLINTNDGAKAGAIFAQADRLYLWETNTQSYISLGLKSSDNMWHYQLDWGSASPAISLQPGQGAWLQSGTNFVWTVTRPYNL